MGRLFRWVGGGVAALVPLAAIDAAAAVLISVDLKQQQMTVAVDGKPVHSWPVSTADSKYVTPTGNYRPQRMHRMWYSRKYDNAPMPHAIFYSGGYAIHGTTSVRALGRPASHGCVRLSPRNAATLFKLVEQGGMAATRIVIHGKPPQRAVVAQRRPQPRVRTVARADRNRYWASHQGGAFAGYGYARRPVYYSAGMGMAPRPLPLRPLPARMR